MRLDLRPRCARCGKLKPEPRSPVTKMRAEDFERYAPFCSYNCQEWARVVRIRIAADLFDRLDLPIDEAVEDLKARGKTTNDPRRSS